MKKKIVAPLFAILILLLLAVVGVTAVELNYRVNWWSIDGGAQISSGDSLALSGIIGQPDTGPVMSGENFTVTGGYWPGGQEPDGTGSSLVYLPFVKK